MLHLRYSAKINQYQLDFSIIKKNFKFQSNVKHSEQQLQEYAPKKEDNNYLLAQNEVEEITAKGYLYCETCRADYTRPMKQLRQDVQKYNQAYMQVVTFVEQVKEKKRKNCFCFKQFSTSTNHCKKNKVVDV